MFVGKRESPADYRDFPASCGPLSAAQLAERCWLIAEYASTAIDPSLQAEAQRIHAARQDAMDRPGDGFDDRTRKAALKRRGLRADARDLRPSAT
jgi:hypothetical protein